MKDIREKINKIKLIVSDIDGVLTDNSLYYSSNGEELKKFNVKDGHGIRLLQNYKIPFALITARNSKIVEKRFSELNVEHLYQGCRDKATKIKELTSELNISLEETAYIGDDILDVPVLEIVGLAACPKDAHNTALLASDITTELKGGEGCVRELIDLILKEQGKITV